MTDTTEQVAAPEAAPVSTPADSIDVAEGRAPAPTATSEKAPSRDEIWAKYEKAFDEDERTDANGKLHAKDGKFESRTKEEEAAAAAEAEKLVEEAPAEVAREPEKPAEPVAKVALPPGVPPALSDPFAKAPKELQDWLHENSKKTAKAFSEYGEVKKWAEPFAAVTDSYADVLTGIDPAEAFANLLSTQKALETGDTTAVVNEIVEQYADRIDGTKLIATIAQKLGIDLLDVIDGNVAAPAVPKVDPQAARINRRIDDIERREAERLAAVERAQEDRAKAAINKIIDEFRTEVGADTFDALRFDIQAYMNAFQAADPNLSFKDALKQAHERAKHANPVIRERLESERRKAEQAEREKAEAKAKAEAEKRAKEARRANSLNVTSVQRNGVSLNKSQRYDEIWANHNG